MSWSLAGGRERSGPFSRAALLPPLVHVPVLLDDLLQQSFEEMDGGDEHHLLPWRMLLFARRPRWSGATARLVENAPSEVGAL